MRAKNEYLKHLYKGLGLGCFFALSIYIISSISTYSDYLEKYIFSDFPGYQLKDNQSWEKASNIGTEEAYQLYIENHPMGHYANQARFHIEFTEWKEVLRQDKKEIYQKFIDKNTESIFREEAIYWSGIQDVIIDYEEHLSDISYFKRRNIMQCVIDKNEVVKIRGEKVSYDDLNELLREFITNPIRLENLAESPESAWIVLVVEEDVNQEDVLEVGYIIKDVYVQIWEDISQKEFGVSYYDLITQKENNWKVEIVRNLCPFHAFRTVNDNLIIPPPPPPPPPVIEEIPDNY